MTWEPLATEDQGVGPPHKGMEKRLRALDADIYGNLLVSGILRLGLEGENRTEITNDDFQIIYFYHEGNAAAAFNTDEPGRIVSTAVEMQIEAAHDSDESFGRLVINNSGATQAEYALEVNDIRDTSTATDMLGLLRLDPAVTGTKALAVASPGTMTVPLIDIENGSLEIWETGIHTDAGSNILPLNVFNKPANFSPTGTGFETAATRVVGDVGTTNPVRVRAQAHCNGLPVTTPADIRWRVDISVDGGSSWDAGQVKRTDGITDYHGIVAAHGVNATPTGDVHVRIQAASSQTDLTFEEIYLEITVWGDT